MIIINSQKEIEFMRVAGKNAASLLDYVCSFIAPGVTTNFLNQKAEEWVKDRGLKNAPLNYQPGNVPPFPKSICTSVNEVICHGIPSDRVLLEGDIINVDVTPITNGFHGDTSKTVCVGKVSSEAKRLIEVTEKSLYLGIESARAGNTLGDIGYAIQTFAEKHSFSVVRDFVGHGIGRRFHTKPTVYHFGEPSAGLVLRPGMIFTIEPMINMGSHYCKMLEDQWTVVTLDRKLSAQFEHTILITENEPEILTK